MSTSFQIRLQVTFCLIVLLICCFKGTSQPVSLAPELDSESGIIDNTIRIIRQDRNGRMWIGTDHGLQILHDPDSTFRPLTKGIGDNSVWALEFHKQYAFIGTRFKGVIIYNLDLNRISQRFDSSETGLSRRFRLFDDTMFLATKSAPVYFSFDGQKWKLNKILTNVRNGFVTDFAQWNRHIYSSSYSDPNVQLQPILLDSIGSTGRITVTGPKSPVSNILSLASSDSILLAGGDGFYGLVKPDGQVRVRELRNKQSKKYFPVWDAVMVNRRPVLALGYPDNMRAGMLLTDSVMDVEQINPEFYGLSLYHNLQKDVLWAGTLNRGLFYWPFMSQSYNIRTTSEGKMKMLPISKDSILLFNSDIVLLHTINDYQTQIIYRRSGQKVMDTEIADVVYEDGSIYILSNDKLFSQHLRTGKRRELYEQLRHGFYRKMYIRKGSIYIFSVSFDTITKIDTRSGTKGLINAPSNIVTVAGVIGDKLIYHSNYSGFHLLDSISRPLGLDFPHMESAAVSGDRLWVMRGGRLLAFRVQISTSTVKELLDIDIRGLIRGFAPRWIVPNNGKLYIGDHQGFVLMDEETGKVLKYVYSGNYNRADDPVSHSGFLFFNYENYLTRLSDSSIQQLSKAVQFSIRILPGSEIYHWTPFAIEFAGYDHMAVYHSLKRIECWRDGVKVSQFQILSDKVEFNQGLAAGDYIIRVYSNDRGILEYPITIRLPLTLNPWFYVTVSGFVILFVVILLVFIYSKKSYNRKLLENRLQLLKQNLNPHFIFNSLNLIYCLVQERKNEAAIQSINNFADLHRYYLENLNKSLIDLAEEIRFIENYLKMESKRVELDDPIEYKLPAEVEYKDRDILVPPMILQPLVENAVRYCGSTNGHRKIIVDLLQKNEKLVIGVENTIDEKETIESGHGMGLMIVQERVDVYNKTKGKDVKFLRACSPRHTETGYRCELVFHWKP